MYRASKGTNFGDFLAPFFWQEQNAQKWILRKLLSGLHSDMSREKKTALLSIILCLIGILISWFMIIPT